MSNMLAIRAEQTQYGEMRVSSSRQNYVAIESASRGGGHGFFCKPCIAVRAGGGIDQ